MDFSTQNDLSLADDTFFLIFDDTYVVSKVALVQNIKVVPSLVVGQLSYLLVLWILMPIFLLCGLWGLAVVLPLSLL